MNNSEAPGTTAVHDTSDEVAADVMNPSPRTCSRFSKVIEAVLIFKDEDCGMVPVVEEGKVCGAISIGDITRWVADSHRAEAEHLKNYITGGFTP